PTPAASPPAPSSPAGRRSATARSPSGASASAATSTSSARRWAASRAAPTRWAGPRSCRPRMRAAPPAASSSTTSARPGSAGTTGVGEALGRRGRMAPGRHRIETPVGVVATELGADGRVTVENVASRRHLEGVALDVPGVGRVVGDVAWGGNWFFLAPWDGAIALAEVEALTDVTWRIREALVAAGVTGAGGAEIDHIELFGRPAPGADSRNFVLCPG